MKYTPVYQIGLLLAGLLFYTVPAQTQTCEELLRSTVVVPGVGDTVGVLNLVNDLNKVLDCAGFDSLDAGIICTSPIMQTLLVNTMANKKSFTYADWLQTIRDFTHTPEYAQIRALAEKIDRLQHKPARLAEWPADSLTFKEIGMPENMITAIGQQVKLYPAGDHTFVQLIDEMKTKGAIPPPAPQPVLPLPFNDSLSMPEALRLSGEQKKPVLLYFSGYGAVNARKMEESLLNDPAVNQYMTEHFVCVRLYVDDRTPLPAEQQYVSPITGSRVRTVGARNSEYQVEKFSMSAEPYFFILNSDEKKLGEIGYTRSKTAFLQFMEAGVAAFGK